MRVLPLAAILLLIVPTAAADPQPEPPGLGDPPCGHDGHSTVDVLLDIVFTTKCVVGDMVQPPPTLFRVIREACWASLGPFCPL